MSQIKLQKTKKASEKANVKPKTPSFSHSLINLDQPEFMHSSNTDEMFKWMNESIFVQERLGTEFYQNGKQAFIQPKLEYGNSGDKYEKEADHAADMVMKTSDNQLSQPSSAKQTIQLKEISGYTHAGENAWIENNLKGKSSGNSLSETTRTFMENRFGVDFSQVRIHTDSHAARMNEAMNAHAFTYGNNIYFNSGNYNPESASGKHLLAHELSHTVQQGKSKRIQKMARGTGAGPRTGWQQVPADQEARVDAAIEIVREVTQRPRLINYFKNTVPSGTVNTLPNVFNRARVWNLINEGNMGMGVVGGNDLAYDNFIYRVGRYQIAATIIHEMAHLAGLTGANERECENAVETSRVYAPFIRSISPRRVSVGDLSTIRGFSFGFSQTSVDKIFINGVDAGLANTWTWSHADQNTITIRVPAGATSGPVRVQNNNVSSNSENITII